nr:hypothetical protein [Actinomycetes bacterium]
SSGSPGTSSGSPGTSPRGSSADERSGSSGAGPGNDAGTATRIAANGHQFAVAALSHPDRECHSVQVVAQHLGTAGVP